MPIYCQVDCLPSLAFFSHWACRLRQSGDRRSRNPLGSFTPQLTPITVASRDLESSRALKEIISDRRISERGSGALPARAIMASDHEYLARAGVRVYAPYRPVCAVAHALNECPILGRGLRHVNVRLVVASGHSRLLKTASTTLAVEDAAPRNYRCPTGYDSWQRKSCARSATISDPLLPVSTARGVRCPQTCRQLWQLPARIGGWRARSIGSAW